MNNTTKTYYKRIGIETGINWDVPRINFSFWHVLSGFIKNESLTLNDVNLAYVEFLETSCKSADKQDAKAFRDWFRDYSESLNYYDHESIFFREEVGLPPGAGKQLGFVRDSLWDEVPPIPTDLWIEMVKYINNETLLITDVETAHKEFLYDHNVNDHTEAVKAAQSFVDWFRDYTEANCVIGEPVGFSE